MEQARSTAVTEGGFAVPAVDVEHVTASTEAASRVDDHRLSMVRVLGAEGLRLTSRASIERDASAMPPAEPGVDSDDPLKRAEELVEKLITDLPGPGLGLNPRLWKAAPDPGGRWMDPARRRQRLRRCPSAVRPGWTYSLTETV